MKADVIKLDAAVSGSIELDDAILVLRTNDHKRCTVVDDGIDCAVWSGEG